MAIFTFENGTFTLNGGFWVLFFFFPIWIGMTVNIICNAVVRKTSEDSSSRKPRSIGGSVNQKIDLN